MHITHICLIGEKGNLLALDNAFQLKSQHLFKVELKFYPTANCRKRGFVRLMLYHDLKR